MKNILKSVIVVALGLFSINSVQAQDGANLFKQNCSACHKLEGNLVGPGLKGVQAKWLEAGEGENLIKWVQNPAELYNSGSSKMAKEAWEMTPAEMTPQALSEKEIIAIFTHIESDIVEGYKEDKAGVGNFADNPNRKPGEPLTDKISTKEEAAAIAKEQASARKMIFILLVITAVCLLLGIVSVSKMIQTISDLKARVEGGSKKLKGTAMPMLVLAMFTPFSGFSLGIDASSGSSFIVSYMDIWILLGLNLLLLVVLLDQKKTLKAVIYNYDPTVIEEEEVAVEEMGDSIVKLLTDRVAIEDEASILMDHEFDGIKELDNNMPPWWVWSFVATIIFAFCYLLHFHVLGTGDLQAVEYQKTVDKAQVEVDAYMSKMAMNVDENNVVLLTEAADIQNGKNIYKMNCVVCHKDNGEGLVGPNLTDDHWVYGEGDVKTVFSTIKYGTSNGMPEHESKLNPIELQQVTSFVLSMEYAEGKAPEGKKVEKK